MILTPGELNRRAQLYEQLAATIAAGVPLMKALEMAGRNRSVRGSRKTILQLLGHLNEGLTFSDSMLRVKGWLPEFDVTLLSVGEQSGRLDATFRQLARYYAARAKIIRDTIAGLVIPGATFCVFLLIFPLHLLVDCAWGFFNSNYSQCVPFLVEKLEAYGGFIGLIFLLVFACQGRHGEPWRALLESVTRWIPILRRALKCFALTRLTSALDALTSAGVSMAKSWDLAAAASGSPRLKREILKWTPEFESGLTPAEMVGQISYFPEIFTNLYATGEMSGKMDETLPHLQTYFEEEGLRALQLFNRLLVGVLYGTLMIIMAYVIIHFWLNYYGNLLNSI